MIAFTYVCLCAGFAGVCMCVKANASFLDIRGLIKSRVCEAREIRLYGGYSVSADTVMLEEPEAFSVCAFNLSVRGLLVCV